MSDQLNLDALLKNEPWIRGLAQGLLSDPGAVDDVVQRTLEAAVETPPQDPAKLKSWLGSVARNAAREQHRRRASRARRERAAAAPESLPSAAELVEREELRRRVVEAVLELDEPYRSTVLWHYFEELEAKAIAARQEIPAATVRTRLKRARDHLRARLDGLYDGRQKWALGLVPLLALGSRAEAAAAAPAGATTGGTWAPWAAGAAALLALAGAAAWLLSDGGPPPAPIGGADSAKLAAGDAGRPPLAGASGSGSTASGAGAGAIQDGDPDGDPDGAPAKADPQPAPAIPPLYAGRFAGRADLVARYGGSRGTERAVAAGLRWLARHQAEDGAWQCKSFPTRCSKQPCDGAGETDDYSPGTTALACLAFLGAGHVPGHGEYAGVVTRGLDRLIAWQGADGCVGPKVQDGHYFYLHAMGALALCEAAALAPKPARYRAAAQQAIRFLERAQNPFLGWRYGVKPGDNDTSCTAWAVQALRAATAAGLEVDPKGLAGAMNWVEKVTDSTFYKTGYVQKGDNGARLPESQQFLPTEAMTAAGLTIRLAAAQPRNHPAIRGGARLVANLPPKWDPQSGNDFYYWYFGSLALAQVGGSTWPAWNGGLKEALVPNQRRGGDEDGSWDPRSAWGPAGGRVYATAVNVMSLQAYYRYAQVGDPQARVKPERAVAGRIHVPGGVVAESLTVDAWQVGMARPSRIAEAPVLGHDGSYRLEDLPEPRVRVTLKLPKVTRYVVVEELSREADRGATGVDFRLETLPSVQLTVVDAETGAAVAKPSIWDVPLDVDKNRLTVYRKPGKHELAVQAPGYLHTTVTITVPAAGQVQHPDPVKLTPTHTLTGSVVAPDGVEPAGGLLTVEWLGEGKPAGPEILVSRLQKGGAFTVQGLGRGRYRVRILVKGAAPYAHETEVSGATTLRPFTLNVASQAAAPFAPTRTWEERRAVSVSVEFSDTPVLEMLRALELATGVRLQGEGDWSAAENGDVRVNLAVQGVSLEDTLALTTDMCLLGFDRKTGLVTPDGD